MENNNSDLLICLHSLLKRPETCRHSRLENSHEAPFASPVNQQEFLYHEPPLTQTTPAALNRGYPTEQVSFTGLVPLPVLLSTIDIYFECCHNQPYSFFHEQNFRDRLSNGLIPDHLLFAVLATATRFSQNSFFNGKTHETAVTYANKSWKSIVASCFARNDAANIMTVQTITLLAIFDFTGQLLASILWVVLF